MRNRRIPPFIVPVTVFVIVAVGYALARHTLTLKGFIVSILATVAVTLAFGAMSRGPYI